MMTTGSAPRRSSPSTNVRPRSGGWPRTSNRFAVMRDPCVCSGAAWSSLILIAPNADAPIAVNDRDCDRQSSKSSTDEGRRRPRVGRQEMLCSSSARSKLNPRMKAALMMLKPTVLAPMPRAIARMAAAENQRSLSINRVANRRSWKKSSSGRKPRTSRCRDWSELAAPSVRRALPRGLVAGHAAADVVFGEHLEMRLRAPARTRDPAPAPPNCARSRAANSRSAVHIMTSAATGSAADR